MTREKSGLPRSAGMNVSKRSASLSRSLNPKKMSACSRAVSKPTICLDSARASKAHNFGVAFDLSRRLADRYPKSLGAQMVHGVLASSLRQFREASDAYHKALSIRPDFPPAYVWLGITDASQNRFAAALSDFQQVTRVAPQLDVGWIGSSACAEKLGRARDSLEFARRATAVAPSSAGAWLQLAREESAAGNSQAAAKALVRANQLRRNAPKPNVRQR